MSDPSHEPMGWADEVRAARAEVVAILSQTPAPMGAYAIIEALARRENKPIAPPTVYRARDFLPAHGFWHRVESRNALARCAHFGHAHRCLLLSCQTCGRSVEIEDEGVGAAVGWAARAAGFTPRGRVLEMPGLCDGCAKT